MNNHMLLSFVPWDHILLGDTWWIQVDPYKFSLGFYLFQNGKSVVQDTVQFCIENEKNYAQIEKGLKAIVYSFQKVT